MQTAAGLRTLVCFALEEEAGAFRKLLPAQHDAAILITGIGPENAERSLREFLARNPVHRVFTSGFAGGLDPKLRTGDVVFQSDSHDLHEALLRLGAVPVRFHACTRMITTAAEKAVLFTETGAHAVEMESAAIARVCRERRLEWAIIRTISDAAADDLPLDFNRLSNPDLSLNYVRLALAIARSPGRIPALWRLQRHCRLAAGRLALILVQLILLDLPIEGIGLKGPDSESI